MGYRIVEKKSFKLVGIKKRVPIIFNGVNPEIAKMYELLKPEIIKDLKALADIEPSGIISASTNFSEGRMEEKGELDHFPKHFKMYGEEYTQNGSLHLIMRPLKDLKFCGMRVRI